MDINISNNNELKSNDLETIIIEELPNLKADTLKSIIDHKYKIVLHNYCDSIDYFVNSCIQEERNDLLEIILKSDEVDVKDSYYHQAIEKSNYNAIIILLDNDSRNKYDVLYKIYEFFDFHYKLPSDRYDAYDKNIHNLEGFLNDSFAILNNHYENKMPKFLRLICSTSINFEDQKFYGSTHHVNGDVYIDKNKYNSLRLIINSEITDIKNNLEQRKKLFSIDKSTTVEELKKKLFLKMKFNLIN